MTTLVKLAIEKFHRFNDNGALHQMTACQCRKQAKGNEVDHWLNDMPDWNTPQRVLPLFDLNLKRSTSQFLMVHFEKPRHSFNPNNITSRKLFIRLALVVFDQMKRLCWISPCPWNYLQFALYWLIHFIFSSWFVYKSFLFEEENVFSNWKRNKQTNKKQNNLFTENKTHIRVLKDFFLAMFGSEHLIVLKVFWTATCLHYKSIFIRGLDYWVITLQCRK